MSFYYLNILIQSLDLFALGATQVHNGLFLAEYKYAKNLLTHANTIEYKPIGTPIAHSPNFYLTIVLYYLILFLIAVRSIFNN